jgi:RNA polymerase sigma factor (sigma-70 family)
VADERDWGATLDANMARLADGDRSAFAPVFRSLHPILLTFCRQALLDSAEAEDLAQAVLEKLFRQAASYDTSRPVIPWVLTIAAYECATARRRQQRRSAESIDDFEIVSDERSPEEEALKKDLRRALRVALSALSEAERSTIDHTFLDDVGAPGMSPALRKRKERALERLRILWKKLNG